MNRELVNSRALQVFVAIIDFGKMTLAADYLGMTQAAVSQHLQQLEANLQTKLFDREQRPMQLTSRGKTFEKYARNILDLLVTATSIIDSKNDLLLSNLTIGMNNTIAKFALKKLFPYIKEFVMLPNVMIEDTPQLIHQFKRGDIDMIIIPQALHSIENVEEHFIFAEEYMMFYPRELVHQHHIDAKYLNQLTNYIHHQGQNNKLHFYLSKHLPRLKSLISCDEGCNPLDMVSRELGWTVALPSHHYVLDNTNREKIGIAKLPGEGLQQNYFLLVHHNEFADLPQKIADMLTTFMQKSYIEKYYDLLPAYLLHDNPKRI